MADAEFIVVCIDTSAQADCFNNIKPQLDAIKLYCKAKLDANPETKVVLFTMGSRHYGGLHYQATSEYQEILDYFKHIYPGGRLRFSTSIMFACSRLSRCPPNKQKRMLFLVGSLGDVDVKNAVKRGMYLKGLGIAVDVVNFYLEEKPKNTRISNQFGRMELDAFVRAANSNDNSHIEHVAPGLSIRGVLSESMLRDSLHLLSMKNHKKATGKNQAAGDDKHVPSEALSLENEGVKLGKRKIEATGWEIKRYLVDAA